MVLYVVPLLLTRGRAMMAWIAVIAAYIDSIAGDFCRASTAGAEEVRQ